MRVLTSTEISSVSGGFYFSSPFIGAFLGSNISGGNTAATLAGAGLASIALVPYCPLHWLLGLGLGAAALISAVSGMFNNGGNDSETPPETTPLPLPLPTPAAL